jgi:hypothetical protein
MLAVNISKLVRHPAASAEGPSAYTSGSGHLTVFGLATRRVTPGAVRMISNASGEPCIFPSRSVSAFHKTSINVDSSLERLVC